MKFREDGLDERLIAAESEEPLFKATVDGCIEVVNVGLDRGVHDDRNIVARIFRLICGISGKVLVSGISSAGGFKASENRAVAGEFPAGFSCKRSSALGTVLVGASGEAGGLRWRAFGIEGNQIFVRVVFRRCVLVHKRRRVQP